MNIFKKCESFKRAEDLKKQGLFPYFKEIQSSEGPVVHMNDKAVVMAGSNNYLGLTVNEKVKNAAKQAIDEFGTATSSSRFLTGTLDMHNKVERRLAEFLGKESGLIFGSGYLAGQGVISPLVERDDYLLSDRDNHTSMVVGALMQKAIGANTIRYKSNDMVDLERRLSRIPKGSNILIASDGVFSVTGELVQLEKLVSLAKKYGAGIVIDDAHGFGVLGRNGRGTADHFGLLDEIDLIVCTFSKSLSSHGGFVAGKAEVINYIKHVSPAFMFSSASPPAIIATVDAALDIILESPDLGESVRNNAQYVRNGLQKLGFNVPDGETGIVPVLIADDALTFQFWKLLFEEGVYSNAFVSPGVPPGKQIIRTSYMASHQKKHLDFVIDSFAKVGTELGLVNATDFLASRVPVVI